MMDHCRSCGSESLETIPGPHPGGHFARLNCRCCGRFVKWLPRPGASGGPMPPGVFALIHSRNRAAPLEGTEAQRKCARSIRDGFLHDWDILGRKDLVALARCVTDATWFIANKGRSPDGLRWPTEDQMEPAVPSGSCPNCGDPAYVGTVCSDECGDEFAEYLARDGSGAERSSSWIDL